MLDGGGPDGGIGAAWVEIGSITNHTYLENNPYQELTGDYDDDNDDNDDGDDELELVSAPVAIAGTTIDKDEESIGVVDKETTGVLDKNIGVATSDNG